MGDTPRAARSVSAWAPWARGSMSTPTTPSPAEQSPLPEEGPGPAPAAAGAQARTCRECAHSTLPVHRSPWVRATATAWPRSAAARLVSSGCSLSRSPSASREHTRSIRAACPRDRAPESRPGPM